MKPLQPTELPEYFYGQVMIGETDREVAAGGAYGAGVDAQSCAICEGSNSICCCWSPIMWPCAASETACYVHGKAKYSVRYAGTKVQVYRALLHLANKTKT